MDNFLQNMVNKQSATEEGLTTFETVDNFDFHAPLVEDSNNGLYFNDAYLPEEIVTHILSYIEPKEILKASLVCKKWCNIIKSDLFWFELYFREFRKRPKKLPWYTYYCFFASAYFNKNLIKNGNGENRFNHWQIISNYGDEFRIEEIPCGSDPLPTDVTEFRGSQSCFATSYYECNKLQEICFEQNRLMQYVLNKFKPHIYLSEWVAGRFDCACIYTLWCKLYGGERSRRTESDREIEENLLHIEKKDIRINQWEGRSWFKVEMLIKDYPKGVTRIVFQHEGRDTQFWKGHYGSKMAGSVLKIIFDSMDENLDSNKL